MPAANKIVVTATLLTTLLVAGCASDEQKNQPEVQSVRVVLTSDEPSGVVKNDGIPGLEAAIEVDFPYEFEFETDSFFWVSAEGTYIGSPASCWVYIDGVLVDEVHSEAQGAYCRKRG